MIPSEQTAAAIPAQAIAAKPITVAQPTPKVLLQTQDVGVVYPEGRALAGVTLSFHKGHVHALIGPSGCGKSTFLRCLNLMNWEIPGCEVEGQVLFHGVNIADPSVDVYALRTHIGMVFQQPTPFKMSIWDNLAFPLLRHGMKRGERMEERIQWAFERAALWDEVKDHLKKSALGLSGGQQQRLCIARSLVLKPDVVLMDEPCSALDPLATLKIEETIRHIADKGTLIVIVTHNMEQAARVSDETSFFYLGHMLETGPSGKIFSDPESPQLSAYISGRMG